MYCPGTADDECRPNLNQRGRKEKTLPQARGAEERLGILSTLRLGGLNTSVKTESFMTSWINGKGYCLSNTSVTREIAQPVNYSVNLVGIYIFII